uniref:Uncharacterized protein n=1 Tax=Vespula pensylvanica TaxID=30213 RepID=A0A834KMK3_VESPE|nr:hypothetical protein H0235_013301 [Vespula pensylvanica]
MLKPSENTLLPSTLVILGYGCLLIAQIADTYPRCRANRICIISRWTENSWLALCDDSGVKLESALWSHCVGFHHDLNANRESRYRLRIEEECIQFYRRSDFRFANIASLY